MQSDNARGQWVNCEANNLLLQSIPNGAAGAKRDDIPKAGLTGQRIGIIRDSKQTPLARYRLLRLTVLFSTCRKSSDA